MHGTLLLLLLTFLHRASCTDLSTIVTLTFFTAKNNGVQERMAGQGAIRMVCNTSSVTSTSFYHNSELLHTTVNFKVTNNILLIRSMQRSVEGNYTCCILNHCSNSLRVIVVDKPVISLLSGTTIARAIGSNVTILASVRGNESPWCSIWEFRPRSESKRFLSESEQQLNFAQKSKWTAKYDIISLSCKHQGAYRLAIHYENLRPIYSPWITLVIQEPPEPPVIPSITTVEDIPAQPGSASQLFLQWTTPLPLTNNSFPTNNEPADKFIVRYQRVGGQTREWEETVVKGKKKEEVKISGLPPCATFNIRVIACNTACNTAACSLPSQEVTHTTSRTCRHPISDHAVYKPWPTKPLDTKTSHNISTTVLVLAVVISGLATVIVIAIVLYCYHRYRPREQRRSRGEQRRSDEKQNNIPPHNPPNTNSQSVREEIQMTEGLDKSECLNGYVEQ